MTSSEQQMLAMNERLKSSLELRNEEIGKIASDCGETDLTI